MLFLLFISAQTVFSVNFSGNTKKTLSLNFLSVLQVDGTISRLMQINFEIFAKERNSIDNVSYSLHCAEDFSDYSVT